MRRLVQLVLNRTRPRMMRRFLREVGVRPEESIVDLGGTPLNWQLASLPNEVILVNRSVPPDVTLASEMGHLVMVLGDVTKPPLLEGKFDVVFSNSTIEHLGSFQRQRQMASVAGTLGRKLWIKTPARGFPLEPHVIGIGIHYLPRRMQVHLIPYLTLRGILVRASEVEVERFLSEVWLLSRREFTSLFPDCEIRVERFLGLPKS